MHLHQMKSRKDTSQPPKQMQMQLLNNNDVVDNVSREENNSGDENLVEEMESCETSQTNTPNENQVVDTTIAESVEEIVAASEAESSNTSPSQLLPQQEVIVSNYPNISCFVCDTQNSSIEFYKCDGCGNSVDEVCCSKDIGNTVICLLCKQKKSILDQRTSSYTSLQCIRIDSFYQ